MMILWKACYILFGTYILTWSCFKSYSDIYSVKIIKELSTYYDMSVGMFRLILTAFYVIKW